MTRTVQIGKYTMFADDSQQTGLCQLQNGRNYEPHIVAELERLIPLSNGFIDIGCNVGIHVLNARNVSPTTPVIACDASPENIGHLLRTLAHNDLGNVTVLPFPLSNQTGIIRTNACDSNMCCSASGLPDSEDYPRLAAAFALDDLRLPLWNLVKIDVEGFEGRVLQGASKLIEIGPRIIFEFCPEITHRSGMAPEDLLQFFLDHDYKLTTLDYIPGMRATFTDASECLAHVRATSKWIADILAEPL